MSAFTLNIDGLESTLTRLSQAKSDTANRVDDVLQNAATVIAGRARQAAPVAKDWGGALRASILPGRVKKLTWEVVAGVHYAPYVEFGTGALVDVPKGLETYAMQFKGKGIRKVNLPARPFLFPALMEYRRQLIEDIKAELRKI